MPDTDLIIRMKTHLIKFEATVNDFPLARLKEALRHLIKQMLVSSFISNKKFPLSKISISSNWLHLFIIKQLKLSQPAKTQNTWERKTNRGFHEEERNSPAISKSWRIKSMASSIGVLGTLKNH